ASEKEILYAMKTTILVVTVLATILALFTNTIYGLYALSADLVGRRLYILRRPADPPPPAQ
ncbi:hypothetical protein scyTo_0002700, partial [Scyliorhinus torazame]|nr:hypothetical protein [Scyliorhinus torazame]